MISNRVIDRLFQRLAACYGAEWIGKWVGVPMQDVRSIWALELAPFADRLDAINWAIDHRPERAPTAAQFRDLCRQAPRAETVKLQEPIPSMETLDRIRDQIESLAVEMTRPMEQRDMLAWARKIVARSDAGVKVSANSLSIARQALRS